MDSRDFLRVARDLLELDGPAHYRSAIGRAYYAVYNVACDLLTALGFDIARGHSGHEVTRERLRHAGDDRLIHVGAQLRRFQDDRVKADYWMRDPHPERRMVAERWVAQAARLIANIEAVLADTARHQHIRRTVKAWEQGDNSRTQ